MKAKETKKQMMANTINLQRKSIIGKKGWTLFFFYIMACISVMFTSCKEDDDDNYIDDGTGILIDVQDQFEKNLDKDNTRAAYEGFPATTFEEGDEIGVYALNGTTVVSNNVKFTKQANGSWTPASRVIYNPDYTYYAYFPYVSSTPAFNSTADGEEAKFANFISSSTFMLNDQSTKTNFTKSNLMTAQGTVSGTRTVKFTMLHKRGLAVIDDAVNKWYYTDAAGTKFEITPVFNTYIPYKMGNKHYYLMKPDVTTTVGGLSLRAGAGKYIASSGGDFSTGTTWQYRTSTDLGSSWGSWSTTKPSWLTITTNGGTDKPTEFGITTTSSTSTTINKGTLARNVPGDAVLKAAALVSNIDLSMVNNNGTARGTRTTANCYLVHAPGTYRLPLVYGNAIKNGNETATTAFKTTETSNTIQNLVNHANADITSPWIKNHGITVDGGKVIWQDVKDMISSVGISGDYLTFTVDPKNIAEGNAVIAATAGGTIVWSWHIWVTNETLSSTTAINTGSHTYNVAPVNIGQINGTITPASAVYAGDLCQVKAENKGITVEFQVIAKDNVSGAGSTTYYYPSPYFQWGRKDAMYPNFGGYDASGTLINSYTNGTTLITDISATPGATIQHPDYWYYNSNNYGPYGTDAKYAGKYNYWDMNQTKTGSNISTATVKTIYDPCPPGFCVPTSNLWHYFEDNSSAGTWTANQGRTWTLNGANLFFPASGYRYIDVGSLFGVGSNGYCWSASAYGTYRGVHLGFNSGYWDWNYNFRSNGFPVRAVVEE